MNAFIINFQVVAKDIFVINKIIYKWDNIELLEDDRKRIDLVVCSNLHAIMDKMLW